MKKILGAISPPVSVVQLGGCGHLQDVADICIEHVEQDVVLVTVQLYRRKLFSYRCVCEVPAIMDHSEVFKLCIHEVVLKDYELTHAERGSQCPGVYMVCLPMVRQRWGKDSPEMVRSLQSGFLQFIFCSSLIFL